MREVDKYFHKFTDNIGFIEIKKDANKPGTLIRGEAYPIYKKSVMPGYIESKFAHGFSAEDILDGIVILLASDPEFPQRGHYLDILENLIDNVYDYIGRRGIELNQREDERAILYSRFSYLYNKSDSFSVYNYGRLLYLYSKRDRLGFLAEESIRVLEELTIEDEGFPLAYYQLGLIEEDRHRNAKAYLYYKKALEKAKDENMVEEIRTKLEWISPEANLELGIDAMARGDLEKALEYFTLSKKTRDGAVVNYYLGKVFQTLEKYNDSRHYYDDAIELGGEFKELFQDYSILLFSNGDYKGAISIVSKGIDINPLDPYLLYNRLVFLINIGQVDKARVDIDKLRELKELPGEVMEGLMALLEQVPELGT